MIKLKSLLTENTTDSFYSELINTDLNAAVEMVKAKAMENGYTIGPVVHKTNHIFNKIDISKSSKHAVLGPAFYATVIGNWNPGHLKSGKDMIGFVGGNIIDLTKPLKNKDIDIFSNLLGRNIDVIPLISLEKRFGSISDGLLKLGYSAALHEGPGTTGLHVAVFDNHMFKLSDTITYDNNKEIIPISQRFNSSSDDIRY